MSQGIQFTSKLTDADMRDVRRITRARAYWPVMLLWAVGMIYMTVRGWTLTAGILARTPSEWPTATVAWGGAAAVILWGYYSHFRTRSRQLSQMNTERPDQMDLTDEGLKCEGPNGATALIPWRNFKGWKEGRQVMLVERAEGNRFFILPVAQLSEMERMSIRQFLQSHIPPVRP
jgi:hypothetical protein